jgi:alkylation response protein AidB-like acyl-CoA dehydrogenase
MSQSIFDAVSALLPAISKQSTEIERLRRLPDDLVHDLRATGAFGMPMPKTWGGPEVPLPDQLRIVELVSTADPAAGWCVMIGSDAGFYSAMLDDEAGHELWPEIDMITAGWLMPAGRGVRVDGGYSVTGRWAFGSCCLHADVMAGGFLTFDASGAMETGDDGVPVSRVGLAPAASWTILDTWYTTGLAGSGSNDYECTDLFIPESHTFSLGRPAKRPGPLYRMPGAFFANAHGVPLGLARRVLDEARAIIDSKIIFPQFLPMRDVSRVRDAVGDAEILFRSTRAYAYAAIESVWGSLEADRPLTQEQRADLTLSRMQCFRMAREVAQRMVSTIGTQAIYATSPLDRLLRDAVTMGQHVIGGPVIGEAAVGLLFGTEPGPGIGSLI